MIQEVMKLSVHQTSKVVALFNFVMSALIYIPVGIYAIFALGMVEALMSFLFPFIYLVVSYLLVALGCWVYNLIASSFGGIEITLEDVD